MKSSLISKILIYMIMFTASVPSWQFHVGVRLIACDIFSVIFIGWTALTIFLHRERRIPINASIKQLLFLYMAYYAWKLISIIGVVIYCDPLGPFSNEAYRQFLLGTVKDFSFLALLFCIGIYVSNIKYAELKSFVNVFVGGIVCSCLYQFLSMYLMSTQGLDLDTLVWPAVSYNLPSDYASLRSQAFDFSNSEGESLARVFRAGGFSGNPNAFAALLACVLPYLFISCKSSSKYIILFCIVLVSLVFTFSRSGMLAVFVSFWVLTLMHAKTLLTKYKWLCLMFFVMGLGFIAKYANSLFFFAEQRGGAHLGNRGALAEIGMTILSDSPIFGVGHNASSEALLSFFKITSETGANLHNFWLIQAVELGLIGLMIIIFVHIYICRKLLSVRSIYSISLFAALIGLYVAGFFNNSLAGFAHQVFIFLFFSISVLQIQKSTECLLPNRKGSENPLIYAASS